MGIYPYTAKVVFSEWTVNCFRNIWRSLQVQGKYTQNQMKCWNLGFAQFVTISNIQYQYDVRIDITQVPCPHSC